MCDVSVAKIMMTVVFDHPVQMLSTVLNIIMFEDCRNQ